MADDLRIFYLVVDQLPGHWCEGVEVAPGIPPPNIWGYHQIGRIPHFSELIEQGIFAFTWNRRTCLTVDAIPYLATGCYDVSPIKIGNHEPRTEDSSEPMGIMEALKRHYPDRHMAVFTNAHWINPGYFHVPDVSKCRAAEFPDDRVWRELALPYLRERRDWKVVHLYLITMDLASYCPCYTPEEPDDCRDTKDAYIRHLDEIIKEMIDYLHGDNGWERTLMVIASDHGYHAGCNVAKEKGAESANYCADHPAPFDCHVWDFENDEPKDVLSCGPRRTTGIVSGGALTPELRGTIIPEAEIIDIAPTVADALNVPFSCEGKSLLSMDHCEKV